MTTPKIEIIDDVVNIKQFEKCNSSDKEIMKIYSYFVESINKLIKRKFITPIENNLIELHKMSIHGAFDKLPNEED